MLYIHRLFPALIGLVNAMKSRSQTALSVAWSLTTNILVRYRLGSSETVAMCFIVLVSLQAI